MRIALTAFVALSLTAAAYAGASQREDAERLVRAGNVLTQFTLDDDNGIPAQLLERAHGVAVIPGLKRGGILIGGRRGRGVLTVRTPDGQWSNPAFITLTGGSIGWQFGAESADVVLVFANPRSVRNIAAGRVTFGGDLSAVAGPIGRRSTSAVTGRSEVYIYVRGKTGLFAGAVFEGARLDIDQDASADFYSTDRYTEPLEETTQSTPTSALRFLDSLGAATVLAAPPGSAAPALPGSAPRTQPSDPAGSQEAVIYPIG
jgi:lipid-binding SYLF domain-containing protein